MSMTIEDAQEYIAESLQDSVPWDMIGAEDTATQALEQFISDGLTYMSDILELWDGATHSDMVLAEHETFFDALRQNVRLQLEEDWSTAKSDAIRQYVEAELNDAELEEFLEHDDFNDALSAIYDRKM